MGSVLLTAGGIVQVLLSFPSAIFFTKTLCQLDFFPFLNFIGLFVIAGIGADDCFVMFDKFQQSKCRCLPGANATVVMKRAYWDSAWAMFLTSMTTAAAFFSNAIIPIAPIRVFAIFMGTMVVFDYVYDITIFAALLAWQHDVVVGYENSGKNTCASWLLDFYGSIARFRARRKSGQPKPRDVDNVIDSNRERRSTAEAVLADKVFPVIHTLRWLLVAALIGAFAGGMIGALKLSTPRDSEVQLLPDDHAFTKFSFLRRSGFKSSTESQVWTKILWGVIPSDNGDHFNPASRATIEWDTSFDLSPTENQNWLKTFCSDTTLRMASNNASYCWFENFENWLSSAGPASNACGGASAIPVPQANFYDCVKHYAEQNSGTQMMNRQLTQAFYTNNAGQTKMKIMSVQFATDVLWSASTEDLEKVWQKWEDYIVAKMASAPVGLKNGFQTSEAWAWMDTVTQMRDGAYIAAGTTLAIAAVTTMISTQNVIITLYSLLCILTILVVTVAGVVSMGWNHGYLEGICLVILIGLSVDYVVHIGHAYAHAARHEGVTRRDCARSALGVMGFPVLSAAFTTLCAALALLQAIIVFFTKFGTIVVLSAVFSSIVSVVLFIALLTAAGPVNGVGDVTRLCGKRSLGKSKSVAY
jgi:5-methyltetrahydrofolate--homocysteine methyltransferase